MRDLIDAELFELAARVLADEATPEERAALDRWCSGDQARIVRLERLRRVWLLPPTQPRMGDVPQATAAVWSRITGERVRAGRAPLVIGRTPSVRRMWLSQWPVLAGLVAGAAMLVAGWQFAVRRHDASTSGPMSVYTTANGQRATVTLPDGNTAILNVASRLEVPVDYLRGNRTLRLHGEALFHVQHHADRPFTVVAGPSTTRVLGTTFIVRHYATDPMATVAVQEGKVAVGPVVLAAAQEVDVDGNGVRQVQAATPDRFAFATGMLTLDGVTLPTAIVELNRWYDADIRIGDTALTHRQIKGKFAPGSLTELAAILEWTLDIRVVREGRVLTLFQR